MKTKKPGPKKRAANSQDVDQRLVKALGHPLRVQILKLLNEDVASPNALSKQVDASLGTVSYHVRLLADLGCLELVRTEPRRGALEHFYRATIPPWFDKESWSQVPQSLRSGVSHEVVSMIVADAAEAIEAGTFDSRSDVHISRTPLLLDDEAWEALSEQLDDVLARAQQLKAEAADRAVENDTIDDLTPCELAILHYERPHN